MGGVLIASPSFLPGYEIDAGNATTAGFVPKDPKLYDDFNRTFSNRIRTYCQVSPLETKHALHCEWTLTYFLFQAGDFFCANGGNHANGIHKASIQTYTEEAIAFLRSIGLA